MQTIGKETIENELPVMGPNLMVGWEMFAPARLREDEQNSIHAALIQAETVIRVQEDRIRVLEELALTDELTGLCNRRGFTLAFERELARAKRDDAENGVVVMVDLDGFKNINDQYGHQAGDDYLRAVAQVLKDAVRSSDTVARLGGDEFALLLPRMSEKQGARKLAKLQQAFSNRMLEWNGNDIPLCASFGLAVYAGVSTVEAALRNADMRLYAHKARNKMIAKA